MHGSAVVLSQNAVPATYPAPAERPGFELGDRRNRQKIWRRPSLSAYVQTGARWLLGRGATTGTPALTGDARRFTDEWSYPAQDHDNLEYRSWRWRGVGITKRQLRLWRCSDASLCSMPH